MNPVRYRAAPAAKLAFVLAAFIGWSAIATAAGTDLEPRLTDQPKTGDFKLVASDAVADLCMDKDDFPVVQIAAKCLAADVALVTGKAPAVKTETQGSSKQAVFIGTIGKSALIDGLIRSGKLDTRNITGKWESFIIATVTNPVPDVDLALVIAGSDRRGTAFGVFTLSEAIGVSPWYWWDDVTPAHRATLAIESGRVVQGPPSVKYRGIFINDEDWSLQPWAAKTFEPETGDIGPKTYAKVFELLLRLKANYLWPAMHPCTRAFNHYPADKQEADDYAIVMGSSHCEQMLRNNVDEYDVSVRGPWDYDRNRDNILAYWKQRLVENGKFENVYTIGMRGIHDSGMPGGGTVLEKVARLQRVIGDQRQLITETINPDPSKVPQIFCPYKEVLTLYQNGLKVPDDVTIVWPDDNYGYIRQLSSAAEQQRSGGAGVYYHVSYWGSPSDYLWLCTTPPALVWEEMNKAYAWNARNLWVLNVGGFKKSEIPVDFFLRLAWNIQSAPAGPADGAVPVAFNQKEFLREYATRVFGAEHAGEIADILDDNYRLSLACKPEFTHLAATRFSFDAYDEAQDRLARFAQLMAKTDALYARVEPRLKNAFYEIVVYPIRGNALRNEVFLNAQRYEQLKGTNPTAAGEHAAEARGAFAAIEKETHYYNEELGGGKWNHIVTQNPRNFAQWKNAGGVPDGPAVMPASDLTAPSVATATEKNSLWAERDGVVSIPADAPARVTDRDGFRWQIVEGLGRSPAHSAITVLPPTQPAASASQFATQAPALEYDFTLDSKPDGDTEVLVHALPTLAVTPGGALRYAIAIDDGTPEIANIATEAEGRGAWADNVLRAAAIGRTRHQITNPGPKHTVRIWSLDAGLVLEKIVINAGGLKPSLQGPPVTGGVALN